MYSFLLVDDEPIIRKGLQVILRNSALTIRLIKEAGNGEEALACLAKEAIDILVTDIRMPKMDGLELCKTVNSLYPNLLILVLSGYDDFKYAQKAIEYGVKDYILKPVDETAFTRSLYQVLKKTTVCNQINHVSLDKLDCIIGNLEKALWEGLEIEIEQICLYLDDLFRSFPLNYCVITLSDLLEMVIKKLSNRLGYPIKTSIPQFKGNNKQELRQWLEATVGQIKEEAYEKKVVQGFELVDLAKQYLQADYNISLEDISRKVGMSPNYFSQTFKAKTGQTFIDYRTEIRIKKAMELLCRPAKLITEILFEVGYTDQTHFTRTFKKYTGVTPSEFREKRGLR